MTNSTSSRPVPILVVGMNRSGTKWLSNELSAHPGIVSVQDTRHTGILETNMLWAMDRKFDLRSDEDYVGLVEMWSKTDFFQITGQSKEDLFYDVEQRPETATAMFRTLMDAFARSNDADFWLQKTSPLVALDTMSELADARIVVIRRNLMDNLRSRIQHSRNRVGRASIVRAVGIYALEEKAMDRLEQRRPSVSVAYEDMRGDVDATLRPAWRFLGLEPPGSNEYPWRRNTSFSKDQDREEVFTSTQKTSIRILYETLSRLPFAGLRRAYELAGRRVPPMVRGTFSRLRQDIDDDATD
jgi:hypothetical protein